MLFISFSVPGSWAFNLQYFIGEGNIKQFKTKYFQAVQHIPLYSCISLFDFGRTSSRYTPSSNHPCVQQVFWLSPDWSRNTKRTYSVQYTVHLGGVWPLPDRPSSFLLGKLRWWWCWFFDYSSLLFMNDIVSSSPSSFYFDSDISS